MNFVILFLKANAPTRAPKGGAISHLNGERYEGGQFMATQYDMPKGYKKKVSDVARKTEGANIRSLTIKPGMSGQHHVYKLMAGESKPVSVFSGTAEQAKIFAQDLLSAKAEQYRKKGLVPHPTELIVHF